MIDSRIRSYVRREGRLTIAQQKIKTRYWQSWVIPFNKELLNMELLFGRKSALCMEIGFGDGDNLFNLARNFPEKDFIGVEVYQTGVVKLIDKLIKYEIQNVRIISHDAVEVLTNQIADQQLSEVFLFFPDPWPKSKHIKRRIVKAEFVELIAEKLSSNGNWHLATDLGCYATQMLKVFSNNSKFVNRFNGFAPRNPSRIETKFERRAKKLGNQIWDLSFKRL